MIQGVHAMFYTTDADATRAFIRDKLRLPAHDVGDGGLIFDAPEGEIGCHPSEKPFHGISFYCDDIEATMAELQERGVEFGSPVKDLGWGLVTTFELPGAGNVDLYQPKYEKS
jgi:catechol 2,3-dioxygenase-like lactoylglutathione lyase family enzyme